MKYKPHLIQIIFDTPADLLDIYRLIYSARQPEILIKHIYMVRQIDAHNNYFYNISKLANTHFLPYISELKKITFNQPGFGQQDSTPTLTEQFHMGELQIGTYNQKNPDLIVCSREEIKQIVINEWLQLFP